MIQLRKLSQRFQFCLTQWIDRLFEPRIEYDRIFIQLLSSANDNTFQEIKENRILILRYLDDKRKYIILAAYNYNFIKLKSFQQQIFLINSFFILLENQIFQQNALSFSLDNFFQDFNAAYSISDDNISNTKLNQIISSYEEDFFMYFSQYFISKLNCIYDLNENKNNFVFSHINEIRYRSRLFVNENLWIILFLYWHKYIAPEKIREELINDQINSFFDDFNDESSLFEILKDRYYDLVNKIFIPSSENIIKYDERDMVHLIFTVFEINALIACSSDLFENEYLMIDEECEDNNEFEDISFCLCLKHYCCCYHDIDRSTIKDYIFGPE